MRCAAIKTVDELVKYVKTAEMSRDQRVTMMMKTTTAMTVTLTIMMVKLPNLIAHHGLRCENINKLTDH